MRVIFLDFDGVINSAKNGFRSPDPDCIQRLNRLVRESGAAVVVSSTWRKAGYESVKRVLQHAGFIGWVAGVTPVHERQLRDSASGFWVSDERGNEINAWLISVHNTVESFVILDDDDDMGDLTPHLIQTDTYIGLESEQVDRAIEALRNCA